MKLGFILNCLLLAVVTADSLNTDQNVDFAASNSDNSGTLTRVIKSVKIKYPLALVPGAIWSQFPDMSVKIDIPFPQLVNIRYNLQIDSNSLSYMVTRLMINGV
jgi:hypothetical protein